MDSISDQYEIYNFSDLNGFEESFKQAMYNPYIKTYEDLSEKYHLRYFRNYLYKEKSGLKVKTMLVEKNYISLTFLSDFLNYYAKTYHPYIRECKRIHFFRDEITDDEFKQIILEGKDPDGKWNSYVGNIVIKPLRKGFVGATLLKPYKESSHRIYSAIKTYEVNLFGKKIKIETMQYQEQDGVVGSCASFALWFAFQITSELFRTNDPSPSDITIMAGPDSYGSGKNFPSTGLDSAQICKAISANGLNPEGLSESVYLDDPKWLKANIYAYLRMGIPVLLAVDLENRSHHLVTVNGYRFEQPHHSIGAAASVKHKSFFNIAMVSDSIIKLYAHDDQIGPFARLKFIEDSNYQFDTSWWTDPVDDRKVLKGKSIFIITPLIQSIKVDFRSIFEHVKVLNFIFKIQMDVNFEWDIYLDKSNHYKEELRDSLLKNSVLHDIKDFSVLFASLPQYIWVVKGYVAGAGEKALAFDIIYDASDLNFAHHSYYASIFSETFEVECEELDILGIFNSNVKYNDYATPELLTVLTEQDQMISDLERAEQDLKARSGKLEIDAQELFDELDRESDEVIEEQVTIIANQLPNNLE